jgi:hypothetical protein
MRADMAKVIVERPRMPRPRYGHGSDYPRGSLEGRFARELEDAPSREALGRGYATKQLNENLQPLVRFLRTHVGRAWNDVRSEIAARVRLTSAVQKHVLDHLEDYVAPQVWFDAGGGPLWMRWGRIEPLESRGMRLRFYVCPTTGRLLLAPVTPRKRAAKPADPDVRVLGPLHELRRIVGVWYDVELRPDPDNPRGPPLIAKKRQLGKRELRRMSQSAR